VGMRSPRRVVGAQPLGVRDRGRVSRANEQSDRDCTERHPVAGGKGGRQG
jgi:hypothetical protein